MLGILRVGKRMKVCFPIVSVYADYYTGRGVAAKAVAVR